MSEYTTFASTTEVWKTIPGYEGLYEASNLGRIKRLKWTWGERPEHVLKPFQLKTGYVHIGLSNQSHKRKVHRVHKLIAATFIGPCPKGYEVNHKNGIRHDNRLENLEYVTRSENVIHSFQVLGKISARGQQLPHTKLTEDNVRDIRKLLGVIGYRTIARKFGVSARAIRQIAYGISWKHVK